MPKYKTRESKVRDFHQKMRLDVSSQPRASLLALRSRLISEEANEVIEALRDLEIVVERGGNIDKQLWSNLLKELADLQYVLSGTLVAIGPIDVDFDVVFNRVHESNLSKLDDNGNPIYDNSGKVVKGPNYQKPIFFDLVG